MKKMTNFYHRRISLGSHDGFRSCLYDFFPKLFLKSFLLVWGINTERLFHYLSLFSGINFVFTGINFQFLWFGRTQSSVSMTWLQFCVLADVKRWAMRSIVPDMTQFTRMNFEFWVYLSKYCSGEMQVFTPENRNFLCPKTPRPP